MGNGAGNGAENRSSIGTERGTKRGTEWGTEGEVGEDSKFFQCSLCSTSHLLPSPLVLEP